MRGVAGEAVGTYCESAAIKQIGSPQVKDVLQLKIVAFLQGEVQLS